MKEIMKENVSYNASTSYNNTINIVSERLSLIEVIIEVK